MRKLLWLGIIAGCFSLIGLALVSCTISPDLSSGFPQNGEAKLIGNQACKECHLQQSDWFEANPHSFIQAHQVFEEGKDPEKREVSCESCHGAGSLHALASGSPSSETITNPGQNPEICFSCHIDVQSQFSMPHHHRVNEGRVNCIDCHDPHGADPFRRSGNLSSNNSDTSCAACHSEQQQTYVFEHEALREGCVSCHSPHGSIHPKMLTERDANLCLKCHSQMQLSGGDLMIGSVSHRTYLSQGTCWSAGCHTAVHGSNINSRLLY